MADTGDSADVSESGEKAQRAKMAEPLSLRAGAEPFLPRRQERTPSLQKIRTFAPRAEVLATLDAVPFTPSQGVCTPTPTHCAPVSHVMLMPQPIMFPGFEYSPGWVPAGPSGSPHASSSSRSDSSTGFPGDGSPPSSQPGTPYGRPLLFSSFYFPMAFSPRALQQAAQQGPSAAAAGQYGGEPHTPTRARGSGGGGGPEAGPYYGQQQQQQGGEGGGMGFGYAPFTFSSPMAGAASPGQLIFTQFFAPDAFGPATSGELPDSPPEAGGLQGAMGAGGSAELDPTVELTPAARQIAAAMCAAQNLQGPPPAQLVELASLLQAYGLVNTATSPSPPSSAASSPEKQQQQPRRTKSAPRTNPDGTVRLNARQRRTLRRAQERAIKALMDMQMQTLGIPGDQAAANMAAMVGMHAQVFGSPPHSMPTPSLMLSAPPPPVQLQPINPMQALYPMPVLPPAPHMLAGGWAGPSMSQPLPGYPMDHSMSMGMPMSMPMSVPLPMGHGAPALAAFQPGFALPSHHSMPLPMGHGGHPPPVGMYGGPAGAGSAAGGAPLKGPGAGGGFGGGPATMQRAVTYPMLSMPGGGGGGGAAPGRGGRLSRFAPGGLPMEAQ